MQPDDMSMRQLADMARARHKDEWTRTANVLSLVYNMNRSEKSPRLSPDDFNPFREGKSGLAMVAKTPGEAAQFFKAMAGG